ncbi:MAG: glutamate--tRNA ligase [Candidatus Woesearchaeota archaeon]
MTLTDKQKELLTKLALKNATKHDGRANPNALIGGYLGEYPDARSDMKNLMIEIQKIVKEINGLAQDAQIEKLKAISPDEFERKERNIYEFLGIKEGDKIKTAFPPGPEKQPHIGHAKALFLNYLLAKKYNGKFCLRFEDTNPDLVKAEFYDLMMQDFTWLGAKWDELIYASDHMELYYKHCEDLLKKDEAYVCKCKGDEIKKGRETGEACTCRGNVTETNLKLWSDMKTTMLPGDATVRLKIDLSHKNSTMRDPSIFRINLTEHARCGTKYRVWPNYDFQNSIMDGHLKITHRLRSKEFEMRNELQRYIQSLLGYNETKIYEFARFNIEGVEASGRIIREKVNSGELTGWDDPTLTTITALRRRGFLPKAIENFTINTGITKNEATMTWDDLIVQNKKLLDDDANRYYFVEEPTLIEIENAPKKEFELNLHPTKRKGGRCFKTNEFFYITKKDYDEMKDGEVYRLIELFNFKKEDNKLKYLDENIDTYKEKGKGMMHYLPRDEIIFAEVMMPTKEIKKGYAEINIKNAKIGNVIQFERFGFCRLDDVKDNKYYFRYTHN